MAKWDDDKLIVGLDIGTSKVLAIVGELTPTGEVEITGVGLVLSGARCREGKQYVQNPGASVGVKGVWSKMKSWFQGNF